MIKNKRIPLELQLFADNGEDNENQEDVNQEENQTEEQEEKKYTDSEVNKMIDEKYKKLKEKAERELAEERKKLEEEQKESAKLAKMNQKEKDDYEKQKLQEENERLKAEINKSEMKSVARDILAESNINISDNLINTLITAEAESTQANVNEFKEVFMEAVEEEVNKRMKGSTPKTAGGYKTLTKDEIMQVKDVNERIKLIQENQHLF